MSTQDIEEVPELPDANDEPENSERERHVIISGKTFLYRQKAPFVVSGKSVLGALEYDEEEDKVRCHECGEWFKSVGIHVAHAHQISAREYKEIHGLRIKAALIAESTRRLAVERSLKMIQNATINTRESMARARAALPYRPKAYVRRRHMEGRNERGNCQAQLLERIKRVSEIVGHTASISELRAHGVSDISAEKIFGCRISEVQKLAGLMPNKRGAQPGNRSTPKHAYRYSKEVLIEILRDFYVRFNRRPTVSDMARGLLPSTCTYQKHFGSVSNAYKAAGLSKKMAEHSRPCHTQLLRAVEEMTARLGHIPSQRDLTNAGISPSTLSGRFNVKTMGDVMMLLGLDYHPERK